MCRQSSTGKMASPACWKNLLQAWIRAKSLVSGIARNIYVEEQTTTTTKHVKKQNSAFVFSSVLINENDLDEVAAVLFLLLIQMYVFSL